MAVPTKIISTSIGFQDAAGNLVASGFLRLQLSQNAEVTSGGGQVTTQPLWLPLTALAKITSQAIWFNDELSPSGTVYSAQLFGSNGVLLIQDLGYWSITGGSADLSAMVPATANVSYSGAVLLTPTGNQTITTGNLTLATGNLVTTSGNLSIGGTSAFTGTATGTKFVGTTISGQSNSAVQVSGAGTVGVGWNNTNGAADQKWADATLSTTSWLLRFVNDANSVGSTIMQATRGALSAVASIVFGAGGGVQTLPTSTGTLAIGNPKVQQFTAGGTFTIPTGVTGVRATVLGGGGAGGGATAANNGGGGGSGGYAIKWLSGLTPGNTIAVTVGAAGSPGAAGANSGGVGGNSSIASGTQTITTVTANGGNGGAANGPASFGGTGGTTTNGDIGITGNVGQLGVGTAGGNGAASPLGGTAGQGGFGTAGAAAAGFGSGGGGGGAAGNVSGGAGSAGIVIFEWVS